MHLQYREKIFQDLKIRRGHKDPPDFPVVLLAGKEGNFTIFKIIGRNLEGKEGGKSQVIIFTLFSTFISLFLKKIH